MSEPGAPIRAVVDVEVRYAETDRMGLVHHSRYLVWFELARTHLCALTGHRYAEVEEMGYFLVVSGAELSYRRGARYGDTVRVHCRLDRFGSRVLGFAYQVRRGDELLVSGRTDHVWVEAASGRPCRIPEPLRPGFESLAP
jgi:acyl-CoA thioester hydrolase